jgi:hypothetical protein
MDLTRWSSLGWCGYQKYRGSDYHIRRRRERELPFELQAGISKRLSHAPFRFTLTLRNLQKFDLTHRYDTTSLQGAFGSIPQEKDGFAENLFRHLLIGAECLPHPNFWIRCRL